MKFDEGMDFVQMRDDSSYVGEVTSKQFRIDTGLGKPIAVSVEKIVWVIFRSKTGYPTDRVQLKDASELSGSVLDKKVGFRSEATGALKIPTTKILALQLLSTFGA
jgi:hypothetical protein